MEQLNNVGSMIYNTCLGVGYWVFGVVTVVDILRHANDSDIEGCIRTLIKGVVGYGSLFLVKTGLDMVKGAF
jgi:hypothetical protein